MELKRANTSSWSTDGGGVTNNSPRMSSYLLPSSGSRWSSSSVHALAGIDGCYARRKSRVGTGDGERGTGDMRNAHNPINASLRIRPSPVPRPLYLASLEEPSACEYRGHRLVD